MANKDNFDSIFDDTKKKGTAKKTNPKKAAAKKPAPKNAEVKEAPAAKAPSQAQPVVAKPQAKEADDFVVNKFKALNTVLKTHEAEVLYRKAKEDKILMLACAVLATLTLGTMLVLTTDVSGGWFGRMILRIFFALAAGLVGLSAGSIIELNRKRLQDILAMIVKIHESFGFFTEGAYPTGNGAYFPNTYKFIGSINDDETNYAQLIIKIASVGAVFAILILS